MSNIINFERDMFWTGASALVSPVSGPFGAGDFTVASSGSVGQRHAFMRSSLVSVAPAAGSVFSAGCLILPPPDGDNVPYRVKGFSVAPNCSFVWSFGYLSAADTVSDVTTLASGDVDDVFVVRPLQIGDPNYGFPLCFFGSCFRDVASYAISSLSVQRLLSKPDQFAAAMS